MVDYFYLNFYNFNILIIKILDWPIFDRGSKKNKSNPVKEEDK
jgi:hypothetical protein